MAEQKSKRDPPEDNVDGPEKDDANPKKKVGFFTRLLTDAVPAASENETEEDSEEQSLGPPGPSASEDDLSAEEGDGSTDEDPKPKKKKLGFLKRLLTEPVAASPDDADRRASDGQLQTAPDVGAAKEQKSAGSSDDKSEALTTEAFESQLQELLDQHGKVLAGKVQFVDLSDTKSKFPDRSEEITETLHSVAAKVIGRHLANEDIYSRLKDSHLIIFTGLDSAEAQQRCVGIIKEISEILEGQGVDTAGIVAKSVVGEVSGRTELEELSVEGPPPEPTDSETDDAEPASPEEVNVRT